MGKVTISNYKPVIGIDYGLGPDYSATHHVDSTVQNNFEEEVKNIRWLWPYRPTPVYLDNISLNRKYTVTIGGVNYPGATFGTDISYPKISFVTPIEFRSPTGDEIHGGYPNMKILKTDWTPLLSQKSIFYEEYYSDGSRRTNFSVPSKFFSEYEPEEEK